MVRKGHTVKSGDVIAYSGASASTSAPHLHYEVFYKGARVDPTDYLH